MKTGTISMRVYLYEGTHTRRIVVYEYKKKKKCPKCRHDDLYRNYSEMPMAIILLLPHCLDATQMESLIPVFAFHVTLRPSPFSRLLHKLL